MARPTPDHGTRACYIRGCRRPECRDANRRYCKQYSIDRHRNGPRRVDAAPAASRIDQWVNDGWAYAQIGRATGTGDTQILKIHHRVYRTINPDTERRILAARLDPRETPRHAAVLAVGTVRRGRALNAIGYRLDAIADGIPMAANKLGRILAEAPDTVPLWVAQGMARLYRELVRTPGPSEIARRGAARRGWYGPLAWDDIDNPDEQPDTDTGAPAGETAKFTRADAQHIAAEIQHLAAFGVPAHEIAARVQRSEAYIRDQLRGARGPGWRQQIGEAA